MPRAGYCATCSAYVWVAGDGSCQYGHPASGVTGIYEADPLIEPLASSPSRRSRAVYVVIAVLVFLSVGLCVAAGFAIRPLFDSGVGMTGEWRSRLAADYPGWRQVSFYVRSLPGEDGGETIYDLGLIPPGRDFAVGVRYRSIKGEKPMCRDDVLRPGSYYSARADALLDFLDATYAKQDKRIVAAETWADGSVVVEWVETTQLGPFSSRVGDYDSLEFDESTGTWMIR